jgi:peroxiredoxin
VQLQERIEGFHRAGLGVAAITYDTPELQRVFIERADIEYPLLSDIDAGTFTALGILNPDYEPGDSAYGIPYPGVLVLDRGQTVRAKIFVEGYETRVNAENVLAAAQDALGIASGGSGR